MAGLDGNLVVFILTVLVSASPWVYYALARARGRACAVVAARGLTARHLFVLSQNLMNWWSLDITREMSIKMYYKVLPTGQEMDSVKFLMGNWGNAQGALGLLLLGLCVIPNCNNPMAGVNCVSGDTTPKEALIMLSALTCSFVAFIALMLGQGKAKGLGFNTVP